MADKVRVDVDEVLRMAARRQEINSVPLEQIEWVKDGKVIEVPRGECDEWRFVGLSNTTFVELEQWRFVGKSNTTIVETELLPPDVPEVDR